MPVLVRLFVALLLAVTMLTAWSAAYEPTQSNLVIEMTEETDAEQDLPPGHAACTSQQLYVTPLHHCASWAPCPVVGDGVFRPPRASLS